MQIPCTDALPTRRKRLCIELSLPLFLDSTIAHEYPSWREAAQDQVPLQLRQSPMADLSSSSSCLGTIEIPASLDQLLLEFNFLNSLTSELLEPDEPALPPKQPQVEAMDIDIDSPVGSPVLQWGSFGDPYLDEHEEVLLVELQFVQSAGCARIQITLNERTLNFMEDVLLTNASFASCHSQAACSPSPLASLVSLISSQIVPCS